ncbi:hypothetical protein CR513_11425, partial [Mucuna pruriens]
MMNDKIVETQSDELQNISHQIVIKAGKILRTSSSIKDFSLESLITRLCIDEEAHKQEQKEEIFVIIKSTSTVLKPKVKKI